MLALRPLMLVARRPLLLAMRSHARGVWSRSPLDDDFDSVEEEGSEPPYVMMVDVRVAEGREEEFMRVLTADVVGTRAEPGSVRMDLLRDEKEADRFYFYMAFASPSALEAHRSTEHYKAWDAFRKSGGLVSQAATKIAVHFQQQA